MYRIIGKYKMAVASICNSLIIPSQDDNLCTVTYVGVTYILHFLQFGTYRLSYVEMVVFGRDIRIHSF
jgi:hypothetical protein